MTVLQVCAYGAEYAGNFIASLESLEQELRRQGVDTVYAFVGRARERDWAKKIEQRTKVYYLPEAKARVLPNTYHIFKKIYAENDISIVHSHFELYDIPATVMAKSGIKLFWHLHDPIDISAKRGLRKWLWKIQYGVVSKRATLISVADAYQKAVVKLGFPEKQTCTLPNGLDLSRVQWIQENREEPEYDFLTFGWDFYRKGDDLILEACDKLAGDGYRFKLLLNGNEFTWPVLDDYLKGRQPDYLVRGEPVSDINPLLRNSRVFIQASRRETFSYAVCEAAYAGLPVISTDIAGLEWAHNVPTVDFTAPEDSDALYRAMKAFLDGKVCTEEQKKISREVIEHKYSTAEWTKRILSIYNR